MRLVDVALEPGRKPVIATGHSVVVVHPLLHHRPRARRCEEEGVMIELIPVLHRGAVDLRRHAAGIHERPVVDRQPLARRADFSRRLARRGPLPAAGVKLQILFETADPFLHRSSDSGGDTARVPVEPEHASERLKPERIRQPPQHLLGPVLGNDVRGDLARQFHHAREEPRRCLPPVQRELSGSSPCAHELIVRFAPRRRRNMRTGVI